MLKVSDNKRFLVHQDGRAFFYLGDTAWELFHRLNRQEADVYLADRAAKGFTVIQAVVLAELDGLGAENAYGHQPFVEMDLDRPNEDYFDHVDYIVDKAESLGLYIGMLPTWGDKVGVNYWGVGPANFINVTNARRYGRFLGERYRDKPIIWILGGDRPGEVNADIWAELAGGLKEGDGGRHLMTYHPCGGTSSSTWFHDAEWLDFNMAQTGHAVNTMNFRPIQSDYNRRPPKPCMDGEPAYEYPPDDMPPHRAVGAYQVRLNAYWALLAGAHGHTYGAHPIWQMYAPPRRPLWDVNTTWQDALNLPGAIQVGYAKALMLSRPFLTRIPDQTVIRAGLGWGLDHVEVTRDGRAGQRDATYIMAFFPRPRRVTLDVGVIAAPKIRGWWFDPRAGQAELFGEFANDRLMDFQPPTEAEGEDWILVLDDAAKDYGPPGT